MTSWRCSMRDAASPISNSLRSLWKAKIPCQARMRNIYTSLYGLIFTVTYGENWRICRTQRFVIPPNILRELDMITPPSNISYKWIPSWGNRSVALFTLECCAKLGKCGRFYLNEVGMTMGPFFFRRTTQASCCISDPTLPLAGRVVHELNFALLSLGSSHKNQAQARHEPKGH